MAQVFTSLINSSRPLPSIATLNAHGRKTHECFTFYLSRIHRFHVEKQFYFCYAIVVHATLRNWRLGKWKRESRRKVRLWRGCGGRQIISGSTVWDRGWRWYLILSISSRSMSQVIWSYDVPDEQFSVPIKRYSIMGEGWLDGKFMLLDIQPPQW